MNEEIKINERLIQIFKKNWKTEFLSDCRIEKKFSYEEFFSMILRVKEKLEQLGFKKNNIVCLIMTNSIELVVLYFASLLIELTVIPIDPNKGKNEIEKILSLVNYNGIIFNTLDLEFGNNKIKSDIFTNILFEKRPSDYNELEIFSKIDYERVYLITFTSGTTGAPKGVMHSFANLVRSAFAFNKRFLFNEKSIFYHNLPMSYMAGILNLLVLPFICGSKIIIDERFEISKIRNFWQLPIKYNANTFWFIPTVLALLLKLDRGNDGIEYARNNKITGCVGTAPLNNQVKTAFQEKYNIQLYESYGLSETLFISTNYSKNDIPKSTGKLLDGVSITFSEENEIEVSVPWMFLGYVNQERNSFFRDEKYLTGDIGEIKEGFLFITDRKKDLIIRGGVNISPKKIEDFIGESGIFEEGTVLGYEDRYLGERTVCFFVKKDKYSEEMKKKLNLQIIESIGKDYHIDEFVRVDNIPKNLNGKIDKPKIREIYKLKLNDYRN